MEQSELGKNEDNNEETSSAGLSDSETATTPDNGAEDMPSEADDATEVDTPVAEASDDGDTEVADETDDEADEDAGEEPVAGADSDEDEADEEPPEEADSDDDDDDDSVAASDDRDDDEEGEDEVNGLRRGDVVEGTIISTDTSEIIIDLGEDREGIVPRREIELLNARTLEKLQEGADIHVYIVNPSNHEGQTILSINHAQEELDWQRAEEYMDDKTVYDGKIGGYNKGGLIVRFGRLRGFVPQSQISDKRMLDVEGDTPEERFSDLVGNNISVKVMEVDRSRNRLILSERAAMREVRQRRKEALITELEEGEIRDGRVVSLENFGAFVDIGGAEGLVHITELSWKHVTHPRQVLDVGQEVRVKVISVDENRNRIGLSIKQLKADPWDEIAAELRTGSLIRATVTKLTKFGAFARVESKQAVEGLIHISELDDSRVEHPRDVVSKGDKLTLRVVKVDVKNRRLGLSLRRVNSPEFLDEDLKRAYEEQEARVDEEPDDEPDTEEAEAADDDTDDTPEEVVAEGTGSEEVEDEVEDAIEKADEDEADDDDDDDESDDDDDDEPDDDEPDNDDDDDDDDDNDESDDDESDEDDD